MEIKKGEEVKVEIVKKENMIQKIGKAISKAGDKISDFEQKHEIGIKRAKRVATLGAAAAIGAVLIKGRKAARLESEIDAQDWKELPDPEDEELDELEAEESSEAMEEPAEE